MKTPRKARTAFIGAGNFITAHHLHTVGHSEIMTVHAICDLDDKRLAQHNAEYHPKYLTKDYHQVIEDPEVDIVIIGTKQDLHPGLIVDSLNAGKWVMCEKPMAETEEETKRVLEASRKARGYLAIGYNRRFAPAYVRTKRLLTTQQEPVYINYRLMYPNPQKEHGFYETRERILYEGTHVLDLVCWLLNAEPTSIYMTGDRFKNNICVLEFPKGSRVSFMCGSMGSYLLWKEYMEVFAGYTAITVSDFVDMRVRGYPGEFDEVFPAHLGEQAKGIRTHGFDFYEICKDRDLAEAVRQHGMPYEKVVRPGRNFGADPYHKETDYKSCLVPDKGWKQAVEHFAQCFLEGKKPQNSDGDAGALVTNIALRAIESLIKGQVLPFKQS